MYCLINHGFHLASLIKYLFFVDRMNDYESMMIHHVATNILLVTSIYGSQHRFGAIILWLHDVPDIFVAIVKTFDALAGFDLVVFFAGYIPMVLSWFYFRLLYFPWIIYGLVVHSHYPDHLSDMNGFLKTQAIFLSCLVILHIRWFKMFIDLGMTFVKSGKVPNDNINHVEHGSTATKAPASPPSTEQSVESDKKKKE